MRLSWLHTPIFLVVLLSTGATFARDKQKCDLDLVHETVGKRLKASIKDDHSGQQSAEVIALVCKTHPAEPAWTVVAMFYDRPMVPSEAVSAGESALFVLAFVDSVKERVVSWHQEVMEGDATTRFDSYSLSIDTARYALSSKVRAVGVRMNTFVSRCGYEGGYSDELSLFVQRGPRLQPVLSNMAMSVWQLQMLSGNTCGGSVDVKQATHYADLSLSMLSSSSLGFADIAVYGKTRTELDGELWEHAGRKAPVLKQTTVQLGTLKFDGKGYRGVGEIQQATRQLHEQRMRLLESAE